MDDKVKSCPYCHKDNEGYVKMFGKFYLRKDHFNGWNLYAGKGKPLPIKFCPMCGRPLEIKQIQVNSIQDDFCGVPCEFMENKLNLLQAEYEMTRDELFNIQKELTDAKAENEQLKNINLLGEFKARIRVDDMIVGTHSVGEWFEFLQKTKAEAYKEFAKKLKEEIRLEDDCDYNCKECCYECNDYVIAIDNLLKEMVGEEE